MNLSRRSFLSIASTGLFSALLLPKHAFSTHLLQPPSTEGVEQKREFIAKISLFAQEQLGLQVGDNFYQEWAEDNKLNCFLYVSLPDKIASPPNFPDYLYFARDESAAQQKQAELREMGYHTLLYKTAGTSQTELSNELLSYSYEALAFVVLHEAFHAHLENLGHEIPYEIEEAFADVIGNWGAIAFAQTTGHLDENKAIAHKNLNERIYKCIIHSKEKIQYNNLLLSAEVTQTCENQLGELLKEGSVFHKNRYLYTVNNAYFLRNQFYTDYYFQLYCFFRNKKSLTQTIPLISELPKNLDQALDLIWK
ncbi:MAG: hypothetical protein ACKVTZ_00990 [Bacteroidia bacterium]